MKILGGKIKLYKEKEDKMREEGRGSRIAWYDGKKVCPRCERVLDPSEFEEDSERSDGKYWCCKRCEELGMKSRRMAREERELNREKQFRNERDEMMRATMEMKGEKNED